MNIFKSKKAKNTEKIELPRDVSEVKAFPHKCFFCKKDVASKIVWYRNIDNNTLYIVGECPRCGYPSIAIANTTQTYGIVELKEVFPKIPEIDIPDELPDKIKELYKELAVVVNNIGEKEAIITIISMGRILLEAIFKNILNIEGNKSLKELIKIAVEQNLIPKILEELSDSIRAVGNKSIHEAEGFTEEDARDIWEFINIIVDYIYILPEKIRRIRERHQ